MRRALPARLPVRREVERAVSKHKPVFPVRISEVVPSPALELFVSGNVGPYNHFLVWARNSFVYGSEARDGGHHEYRSGEAPAHGQPKCGQSAAEIEDEVGNRRDQQHRREVRILPAFFLQRG